MKKLRIMITAVAAVVCAGYAVPGALSASADKVIAYYFHGTFRCYTCTNMEKFSREAIETRFKDARAAGKLEFKAVNVEESENRHFIQDYKLYTKSLILSSVKDGREVRFRNLDKIWELSRNKQRYIDYVTGEVEAFMKEAE